MENPEAKQFSSKITPTCFVQVWHKKAEAQHYNGLYLVVSIGPGHRQLLVVKPQPGYEAHSTKTINAQDADITDFFYDDESLEKFIAEHATFSRKPQSGEKLQWVEYVYHNAGDVVSRLQRALASRELPTLANKQPRDEYRRELGELKALVLKLSAHLGVK